MPDELQLIDAYWRAANYLSVGQIYLLDNPLLREPLRPEQIKPRLLGHWGTTPGLNFIYVHVNRVIRERDLSAIFVTGPGHGGPALVANTYLEGTYTEVYPRIGHDEEGLRRLFRQFSFPGGIPSHVAPETPGSINEGGELGYSLLHAYGAVFDNPDLLAVCVVGDGEAETGPLAASWHSNKFLDAAQDGAVLPVLHLNGYKIANPTVLARIGEDELRALLEGYGYAPRFVFGSEPAEMHQAMAATLDNVTAEIGSIQAPGARELAPRAPQMADDRAANAQGAGPGRRSSMGSKLRARSALIRSRSRGCARTPRISPLSSRGCGPTGPMSCSMRAAPCDGSSRRSRRRASAGWGPTRTPTAACCYERSRFLTSVATRSTSPRRPRRPPKRRACSAPCCATSCASTLTTSGSWVPMTASNRLGAVFEQTNRAWDAERLEGDDHLAPDGRVMEVLSEHLCEGWLEGYVLTGRHGLFNCYEAFIHIVDSMFNQHAKWLKVTRGIPWRRPIASLNYLLSSLVWRQDQNGFSHQDPGFIDHVMNKKAEVVRVYLPPDANCLLSVADHWLRSRDYVNVIVAGKQPALDYLTMEVAIAHCTRGIGIWAWASSDGDGEEPDVVLACAGDVPTLEVVAAASILRERLPELRVRVVNVVDLMRLEPDSEHPHGLSDREFDALFTSDRPVIFAYHGYPWLIHRLTYRRNNHHNIHVRGYKEEGTTTTPFDMVMLNDLDRYHIGDGRDRPRAEPGRALFLAAPGHDRHPPPGPRLHPPDRRRPA